MEEQESEIIEEMSLLDQIH